MTSLVEALAPDVDGPGSFTTGLRARSYELDGFRHVNNATSARTTPAHVWLVSWRGAHLLRCSSARPLGVLRMLLFAFARRRQYENGSAGDGQCSPRDAMLGRLAGQALAGMEDRRW